MINSKNKKYFWFITILLILAIITFPPMTAESAKSDFIIQNNVLIAYNGEGGIVEIPNTVKVIGYQSFNSCQNITDVIIPKSVTSIEDYAFNNCQNLKNISFSKTIISIGGNAFTGTAWISDRQLENPLVIVNDILIDGTTCKGTITLPTTISSIAEGAFFNNKKIIGITIPDSVTSIGPKHLINA